MWRASDFGFSGIIIAWCLYAENHLFMRVFNVLPASRSPSVRGAHLTQVSAFNTVQASNIGSLIIPAAIPDKAHPFTRMFNHSLID